MCCCWGCDNNFSFLSFIAIYSKQMLPFYTFVQSINLNWMEILMSLSQTQEGIPQPGWNKIFRFVGTFPCLPGLNFARDSWARWVLLLRVPSNHFLPEKIIFNQRKIVFATIDYFPVSRNDFLSQEIIFSYFFPNSVNDSQLLRKKNHNKYFSCDK